MSIKYQGSCTCGAIQLSLLTEPIFKYYCHCSHCRRFASLHQSQQQPHYAACGVWAWTIQLSSKEVEYEHTVGAYGLFSLQRGRCKKCKDPIIEHGGRAAIFFAMVPAKPFNIIPDCNLYYDSGSKQGPVDGVKRTVYSDIGSLLYEVWLVLTVAIPSLPASLWAWWKYGRGQHCITKSD